MQSRKRSAMDEAERKRAERERVEAQSREARERALRGETNGTIADLSRSLKADMEQRHAATVEKLRAGGDSAMQVIHSIADPEKRSQVLESYTAATRDKKSDLYNPNQTMTYKQGLSALEKLDKLAAQAKADNKKALDALQVDRNKAKLDRLAKGAIQEDDRLLYELNTRLRSSTDKGVVGQLRRGHEFTAAGITNEAVERMIQGIPDEQKRREAADIYTRLQKYEGSPLYREFGKASVSMLSKPTEDAELYAEYGGQSYIVPAPSKTTENQDKAEKGLIESLAEKWLEITGGSPDYAAGPMIEDDGNETEQRGTKAAGALAKAAGIAAERREEHATATPGEATSEEEQVIVTPGEATSGQTPATAGKQYDTPAGPPKPEMPGYATTSDARTVQKLDQEIADIESQIATLDAQIAGNPGAFGESLKTVRAQLELSLTQRQSERLAQIDAARVITDAEALSYYKRGQIGELSEEQQKLAQAFAEDNELLLERENYFVKGMRESHLGESAMEVLALTDSEYLTDQERGEVLLGMADDLQAAKSGGYATLGAYYDENPEAKERYGEYVVREAQVKAETDAEREREQAKARAQLDHMVGLALTNEALGQTTDADKNVLRYLEDIDIFEDQEPFFYNLYDGVDQKLQDKILYGDLAGGEYDYLTMVDYARDALKREKQYAAALGMNLEAFWAEHPERTHTAEDYVAYATERYDALWNEPIDRAIASGEITDDSYKLARFFMGDAEVDALIAQGGEGIGMLGAAGLGVKAGSLDVAAGLAGAGVGLMDMPTEKRVTSNAQTYTMIYGALARAQLRTDLLTIAYNQPDQAERERMLQLIADTPDVFDVPIDTRPHLNLLKNARTNLTQSAADVKRFADENCTVNERLMFDTSANITTNVESFAGGALVTALSGSPALGLAIGYGLPEFGNNYYDYMAATGGDVNRSKWGANLSFATTMATESIPFERYTGMLFGGGVTAGAASIAKDQGVKGLKSVLVTGAHIAKELGENTLIEAGQEYLEGTTNDSIQQLLVEGDLNLMQAHQVGVEGSKASLLTSPMLFFLSSTSGRIGDTVRKHIKAADGGPVDVAALVTELNELSPAVREEEAATIREDVVRNRADELTAEQIVAGALATEEKTQAENANAELVDAQAEKNAADTALADAQQQKDAAVDAVAAAQGAALKAASKELQTAAKIASAAGARAADATRAFAEKKAAADAASKALEGARLNTLDAVRVESLQQAQREYSEVAEMHDAATPRFVDENSSEADINVAAEKATYGGVASAQKQLNQANAAVARLESGVTGLKAKEEQSQARFEKALAAYGQAPTRENQILLAQAKKQYKTATTKLLRMQDNLLRAQERVAAQQSGLAAETARAEAAKTELAAAMYEVRDSIAALPAQQQETLRKVWQERVKTNGVTDGTMAALEAVRAAQEVVEQARADADMNALEETADVETTFTGRSLRDPVVQRFVSDVAQRTGTQIDFVQLADGDEGYYDRANDRIVLADGLGGADAIRRVTMHELTHSIEGTAQYAQYAELAMQAAYGANGVEMQSDLQDVMERYAQRGITLDEAAARAELVAEATRKVIYADKTMVERLTRTNRSFVQQLYDSIRAFFRDLKQRRYNPQYADIRKAQKLFEQALNEKNRTTEGAEDLNTSVAQGPNGQTIYNIGGVKPIKKSSSTGVTGPGKNQSSVVQASGTPDALHTSNSSNSSLPQSGAAVNVQHTQNGGKNARHSYVGKAEDGKDVYESNFPPNTPAEVKRNRLIRLWQSVWSQKPIELEILKDGKTQTITAQFDPDYDPEGKRMTDLGKAAYNKNGASSDRRVTLNLGADLYRIIEHTHQYDSRKESGKASAAHADVSEWHYFTDDIYYREDGKMTPYTAYVDVKEKPDGGFVYQAYLKQKRDIAHSVNETGGGGENATSMSSDNSITEEAAAVNSYSTPNGGKNAQHSYWHEKKMPESPSQVIGPFGGYSSSVSDRFGTASSDNSITEEAAAVNSYYTPKDAQHSIGQRQFGTQTAQTIEDIPESIRRGLAENSGYETDTNDAQIIRAYNAYQVLGAEAAAAEVLSREGALTADDVALAQVTVAHAIQDGELLLAAQLLDRYNKEGTELGQALQSRKIMSRLSVQGAIAEMTKRVEAYNQKALSGLGAKGRKADLNLAVKRVIKALPEGTQVKTDGGNNRWHIPLNSRQIALIQEYGLSGESLPGIHYNRATLEQRMLAAILATPDISRGYGHLDLIEQLEYMRRGYAVTTEADLNYIGMQMQTFVNEAQAAGEAGLSFDAVTSREARLALARAYEAAGNTVPVRTGEKATSLLYMNMLQRPVTAIKNVLSNVSTRPLELTSTAIASLVDRAVARETGERTTGLATKAEAKAARKAFAQEVANTWADYFVDKADTSHGAKYSVGAQGRTYQTAWLEAAKALVDFSMQIGDRPFYEQCYAEELAVIRRLNPEMDTHTAQQEATARALERVFQEDNAVTAALSRAEQSPFGFIVKLLVPFAKTPTNVVSRMAQYSPVGLVDALVRKGLYASLSRYGDFSQRDFVMGIGRGLTGTGLMLAGMLLGASGVLRFGSGDEGDKDKAALMQANGVPYSTYIVDFNGNQHEIEWALPMAGPLVMGASFGQRLEDDEELWAAAVGGLCDMGDELFDSSFLQSLTSVLQGNSDSPTADIGVGVTSSLMGMLVPGNLRAMAKAIDPYVRDTSAQGSYDSPWTTFKKAFNQSILSAIPGLRQMLPTKVDVTGQPMKQNNAYTGILNFLDSFFTPTATLAPRNDPALAELLQIADRTGDGSWLPGNPLYGTKYDLSVAKTYAKSLRLNRGDESYSFTLTPEERAVFNQDFGRLLFDGGTTIDSKGKRVIVPGLREIMEERSWAKMDDLERIELVKEMSSVCKAGVTYEWAKQKHKEAGQ